MPRLLVAAALLAPVLSVAPAWSATDAGSVGSKVPEPSEPRATYARGVLTVQGTPRSEQIKVFWRADGFVVKVDGIKVPGTRQCLPKKCRRIKIIGRDGDDRIRLGVPTGWFPRLVLNGGPGDDELTGHYWRADGYPQVTDTLIGGSGNDTLITEGGSDVLRGGLGADNYVVDGSASGRATIYEPDADGPDRVTFEYSGIPVYLLGRQDGARSVETYNNKVRLPDRGVEQIISAGSNDQLIGEDDGVDYVRGGGGNDSLVPRGSTGGTDLFYGDGGNDLFQICGSCHGSVRLEDSSGGDTVLVAGISAFRLDTAEVQHVSAGYDVQLGSATAFENVVGGSETNTLTGNGGDNYLAGNGGNDDLTGAAGADTFFFGGIMTPGFGPWGDDTVTDFATGVDTVELAADYSVKSGLGSATVTIWDGVDDKGSVTATNGHLWQVADFS